MKDEFENKPLLVYILLDSVRPMTFFHLDLKTVCYYIWLGFAYKAEQHLNIYFVIAAGFQLDLTQVLGVYGLCLCHLR